MEFYESVRKLEEVIRKNGLAANKDFRESYFRQSGLDSAARPVAEKGAEIMLKVVTDGINGGFISKRKSIIASLADSIVRLAGLGDGKIKKIRQIEGDIERLGAEAERLSEKDGGAVLDLAALSDYCEKTKSGLEILLESKFCGKEHFDSTMAKNNTAALIGKLQEVIDALNDGEIRDLSSKTAGKCHNEIYSLVYDIRNSASDGGVTTEIVQKAEECLAKIKEWKGLSAAPDKRERIGDKEKGDYVHSRAAADEKMDTICGFRSVKEGFEIFESALFAAEERVSASESEIDEKEKRVSEAQAEFDELENKKKRAAMEYKNDGNMTKFHLAVEDCNRREEKLKREINTLKNQIEKRRQITAAESSITGKVREMVYDQVIELSRTPYLFCKLAGRISWPVMSKVLRGDLGAGELKKFQIAIAEVKAEEDSYIKGLGDTLTGVHNVDDTIKIMDEVGQTASNRLDEVLKRDSGTVSVGTELTEEELALLASVGGVTGEVTEDGETEKGETVLPGLSESDR